MHVCVEPVVAGTQTCQSHLAGPVKKVVCILLMSAFQRCFDDSGLFLVMDFESWSVDNLNCVCKKCVFNGTEYDCNGALQRSVRCLYCVPIIYG